MENKIMNFKNEMFNVDAKEENGQVLFNAEKVAKNLGFEKIEIKNGKEYKSIRWKRVNDCLKSFDQTWAKLKKDDFIPEQVVYLLAMKANNETAIKFQMWLATDVLPSIRKHGMYAKDELLDNPDLLIEVATELKKEREARKIAENKVQTFLDTENYLEWNTVAKNLEIGRNIMLRKLREKQILQTDEFYIKGQKCTGEKHNIPYQKYMKYFKVKHVIKNDKRFPKVVVTADGQEFLRKILNR